MTKAKNPSPLIGISLVSVIPSPTPQNNASFPLDHTNSCKVNKNQKSENLTTSAENKKTKPVVFPVIESANT